MRLINSAANVEEKAQQVSRFQSAINQIQSDNSSVISSLESSQLEFSSLGENIARIESTLQSLEKTIAQTNEDIEEANSNYLKALENEQNEDKLTPKEKAINLLDEILEELKNFGTNGNILIDKAMQLKDSLLKILKIASNKSQTLKDEYSYRKTRFEEKLLQLSEKQKNLKSELDNLVTKKELQLEELENLKAKKTSVEEQVRDLDKQKSTAAIDLQSLETNVNNLKLDLRTYEVNLDNATTILEKAEINIDEIDPQKYALMNLSELEHSLSEIQSTISSLGSINLAAPDEYLSRQDNLSKLLEDTKKKKIALEKDLSDLIQRSSSAEAELSAIKQKQSKVDESIRESENKKSVAELDLRSLEEKSNNLKLDLRTFEVNLENAAKDLEKAGLSIETLNPDNYAGLNIRELEGSLESIQSKILALGAINLAAPDEIAEESKRLEELDAQLEDLNDAMEKLQGAIKKIDAESKTKFDESFNAVNAKIQEIFPKLFGGGKASLELLDGDTLNSGITLAAQPPGKKNATISQLSGGEKAMTALSLVFALFELNPAPFCMLDEVDAPLDDLNATRFVAMVEEMSDRVQFIFITHNKISMEKSDHLMGVTMQEAGVSRVVSVDVKEALELAAS